MLLITLCDSFIDVRYLNAFFAPFNTTSIEFRKVNRVWSFVVSHCLLTSVEKSAFAVLRYQVVSLLEPAMYHVSSLRYPIQHDIIRMLTCTYGAYHILHFYAIPVCIIT